MSEINRIADTLQRTFEKHAWHGPSVKETLQGISQENCFTRLPNTHSIIELVSHMTAWRVFTSKKLRGDVDFKVEDDMNFKPLLNWDDAVKELEDSQRHLLRDIKLFPDGRLIEIVPHPTYRYTFYTLLHGIIHHDLYHTGQIALIKKSFN
jgi:uncharacterized damage-inducible protein DinB